MSIFLLTNNERTGPFSMDQVQELVQRGEVPLSTLAWHEGMTEWGPIHSIPALIENILPPPPPPAPQAIKPPESVLPLAPKLNSRVISGRVLMMLGLVALVTLVTAAYLGIPALRAGASNIAAPFTNESGSSALASASGNAEVHHKKDYTKASWKMIYSISQLPNKDAEFHSIAAWDKHNLLLLGEVSYRGEGHARLLELRLKDDQWVCSDDKADGHYAHYSAQFRAPDKYLLYYEGRGPFAGALVFMDQGKMQILSKQSVPDGFGGMYVIDENSIYFPGRMRTGPALYRYYEPMHRIERAGPAQESVLIDGSGGANSKTVASGVSH